MGGDPGCDHEPPKEWIDHNFNAKSAFGNGAKTQSAAAKGRWYNADGSCKCGARRVDSQLGLEATPDAFVAAMTGVFREVRRVLRDDGTCWINLGDSFAHNGACGGSSPDGPRKPRETDRAKQEQISYRVPPGLKPKDLVGIPWRCAFALQADGWYLRSDIIWHKPNPMPESVTDRPTKSHEYVFLMSKRERYYFDSDAVREPHCDEVLKRTAFVNRDEYDHSNGVSYAAIGKVTGHDNNAHCHPAGRNIRSVWTITPQPFKEAHFATFPVELAARCIKAGTSEKGACPTCGAPWEREGEVSYVRSDGGTTGFARNLKEPDGRTNGTGMAGKPTMSKVVKTLGWRPTCSHQAEPIPATVFDPFMGAATTIVAAEQHGRLGRGIELSPQYVAIALERLAGLGLSPVLA